jgi:hypothetical protein
MFTAWSPESTYEIQYAYNELIPHRALKVRMYACVYICLFTDANNNSGYKRLMNVRH